MARIKIELLILLLVVGLASCATPVYDYNWIDESNSAANTLYTGLSEAQRKARPKILVVSFVNIDDLSNTSTFGRMQSEIISTQLSQYGLDLVEVKLRSNIYIKEKTGEFYLSRDIRKLSHKYQADLILAGTYAIALDKVYISAKLMSPEDNSVWSAVSYSLNKGPNMLKLLNTL